MKIVYIVEEGQYSDKGVIGVFTTREKAEEYAARRVEDRDITHAREGLDITEWTLDEEYVIPPDMNLYNITLNVANGDVIRIVFVEPPTKSEGKPDDSRFTGKALFNPYSGYYEFCVWAVAQDRDHARKIAGEKLAIYKAQHPEWATVASDALWEHMNVQIGKVYGGYPERDPRRAKEIIKLHQIILDYKQRGLDIERPMQEFRRLFPNFNNIVVLQNVGLQNIERSK